MIQDYCKASILRRPTGVPLVPAILDQCGRVLRTDGECDNADLHVLNGKSTRKAARK
jgi:hypothetical protein